MSRFSRISHVKRTLRDLTGSSLLINPISTGTKLAEKRAQGDTTKRHQLFEKRARLLAAVFVGAGVPLVGFPPLVNAPDVLGVVDRPFVFVLLPAVLLVVAMIAYVCIARNVWDRSRSTERASLLPAGLAFVAYLVAALISLAASDHPILSLLSVGTAVGVPLGLAAALHRARLDPTIVVGAFVLTTSLLLARADLVFLSSYGLPTGADLFAAKFQSSPYDFHYYTLGNPDQTAAFLVVPLAFTAFWATGTASPKLRVVLVAAALFLFLNFVLVYVRVGMAFGVMILLAAVLGSSLHRRVRVAITVGLLTACAVFAVSDQNRKYLGAAFSTDADASGIERLAGVLDGLRTTVEYPLTGVGFNRYAYGTGPLGSDTAIPAHSAVVQAGAETGFIGMAALAIVVILVVGSGLRAARQACWRGLRAGAGVGIAAYGIQTTLVGGASNGLANGFNPIWGMAATLALVVAVDGFSQSDGQNVSPIEQRRDTAPSELLVSRPSAG